MDQKVSILSAFIITILSIRSPCTIGGVKIQLGEGFPNGFSLNRIGQCESLDQLYAFVPDARIAQFNSTHYAVSLTIGLRKSYQGRVDAEIWIEQCNSTKHCAPATRSMTIANACEFLQTKSLRFLIDHAVPAFKCPIRVGAYRFSDVIMDNALFR